jgi:hypothetical protein
MSGARNSHAPRLHLRRGRGVDEMHSEMVPCARIYSGLRYLTSTVRRELFELCYEDADGAASRFTHSSGQ